MTTYPNNPVIVVNKKQIRPNGQPKIEGIGILVREMKDDNKFTIYYIDSKTVQDYSYGDYYTLICSPFYIHKLSISAYICLDKTRGFFDLDKFSDVLSYFDGAVTFNECVTKLEYDLNMFGKTYLKITKGNLVTTFIPEQMEEILSKSPKTSVLQFLNYNLCNATTVVSIHKLVSINYNSSDIEDVINLLKTGLILDNNISRAKDELGEDTCKTTCINTNLTTDMVGFKINGLDKYTKYDYAWFNPARSCGKEQWLRMFGANLGTCKLTRKDDITATELEYQRNLKRLHQEYMKSQEVREMLYKLDFTTTKGKRYASYGKHNGEEIPTITTIVNFGGRTGKATVDEKDYDERQGILEALGNAIYGSFETEYQKYCKQRNKEDKKLRICTVCGKLYDTQEEAKSCEKAHKERKEADNAKWIIRKEAIRRLKEQIYEDAVNDEMDRLKTKPKDKNKKNKTTE